MSELIQKSTRLESFHYYTKGVPKQILEAFAQPSLQMKTIGLRELDLLPKAIERFPNLESLRIFASCPAQNQNVLSELFRLPMLQHLWLGVRIRSNQNLFNVLRSCRKLQSLRLRSRVLSIPDFELLAAVVPHLTNLDLAVRSLDTLSAIGYVRMLHSLHLLEFLSDLPGGILSRLTRPLEKLHHLSITFPTRPDMLCLGMQCPNLNSLTMFLSSQSTTLRDFCSVNSLEKLTIVGGVIASLPTDVVFPSVKRFSMGPSDHRSHSFTIDNFFTALCVLFPNLEYLCIYCVDEVSSATIDVVCCELKALTQLMVRYNHTRVYQYLFNCEEISQRRCRWE